MTTITPAANGTISITTDPFVVIKTGIETLTIACLKVADAMIGTVIIFLGAFVGGHVEIMKGTKNVVDGVDESKVRQISIRRTEGDGGGHWGGFGTNRGTAT